MGSSCRPSTSGQHDPRYYLSLGDSLSTGVQPIGPEDRQFRTDEGYSDQLCALAHDRLPGLRVVKLGYPGESTTTMLDGGLFAYPHGNQLSEAVAFLRRHRGEVDFVTLDIGFNDFPTRDLAGIAPGLEAVSRNLPGILYSLREAAGPETPIAGMTIYDPFLAGWVSGSDGQDLARASVYEGVLPINAGLTAIYAAAGMAVADVEGAFATSDFETIVQLDGFGPAPLNVARIHEWTWAGSPPPLGPDPHANAKGYRAIAEAFAKVLLS
ncbi:MAG: SGNH/GDSL hydrolase family protein [Candidatus Limnocylindrales bacterium]|jgi:lysophospholipase L1-like esterase